VSQAQAQNCATTSALLKIFLALAFDLTLSPFSPLLSLFTPERAFLKSTASGERRRERLAFFPLLVTPASQPPTRLSNSGKNIKKRSGDAESFA
jgi:hypothetical protein